MSSCCHWVEVYWHASLGKTAVESLSQVLEWGDFLLIQEGKAPACACTATPLCEVPEGSSRVCANPGEAGFCSVGFILRLGPARVCLRDVEV